VARPRILVVDDETGMLRSVERVLAPRHEVRTARTASQALEISRGFAADLAILDVRMPEMDGFELMAALKAAHPDLDVILMTGSVHEADARLIRAIRERAFYFIHKPFDRDVLLTLVARCLELRRLGEENRRHVRRLEGELAEALAFQRSLLPPGTARLDGVSIEARWLPCVEMCGDFYDYAASGHGVTLLVADVSGHGAPAAMMTGMIKSAFHASAGDGHAPLAVIERISASLPLFDDRRYVTAICARLSRAGDRVDVVNAGHPGGLLIRAGRAPELISSTGPILHGAIDGRRWDVTTHSLGPGDQLLLYTDGVTEARDGAGDHFGVDRLAAEAGAGHAGAGLLDHVLAGIAIFQAGRPLEDDLTLCLAWR